MINDMADRQAGQAAGKPATAAWHCLYVTWMRALKLQVLENASMENRNTKRQNV